MNIGDKAKRIIGLIVWFSFAKFLPKSVFPFIGTFSKRIRYWCGSLIFKKIGKKVNIENLSYFGNGSELSIGDYSGIGTRCRIPSNILIGKYVMMAEEVIILNQNHEFKNINTPMMTQGEKERTRLQISDDVWIGTRAIILPSVTKIGKGAIIAAGSVVTKNVEDYSIVAGNPAREIARRK